jgi:hypothetical protein
MTDVFDTSAFIIDYKMYNLVVQWDPIHWFTGF